MKRVGVLSNPRSGTSLMVKLLTLGFDLSGAAPLFPHLDGSNIYEFRADVKDLITWATEEYRVVFILRDPRSVVTSIHPSQPDRYFVDFYSWELNYNLCMEYRDKFPTYVIRYEDLIPYRRGLQEKLSEFLGLPVAMSFSDVVFGYVTTEHEGWDQLNHEMGKSRIFDSSKLSRWKEPQYSERLLQQIKSHPNFLQTLIDLGYEQDDSWIRRLNV